MSDILEFTHKFEIYTGKEEPDIPNDEPDLDVTSKAVVRLARTSIPQKNYRLYHESFYTSLVHLAKKGNSFCGNHTKI